MGACLAALARIIPLPPPLAPAISPCARDAGGGGGPGAGGCLPATKRPVASVSIGTEYTRIAVTRALEQAGWEVVVPEGDNDGSGESEDGAALHWSDFHAIPWEAVLDGRAAASAQYLKTGLVRKATLQHYMSKHGVAHWLPPSIVADIEDEKDVDALIASWARACARGDGAVAAPGDAAAEDAAASTAEPSLWLLKPSCANRGEGISVLVGGDEASARAAIARFPKFRDWLLQRYVLPLLLPPSPTAPLLAAAPSLGRGLKCHLRLHVLAIGSLSVWVHDAPLVLLASKAWVRPTHSVLAPAVSPGAAPAAGGRGQGGDGDADCCDGEGSALLAHVTNYCRQKHGGSYQESAHTRRFHEAFGPALAASLLAQAKQIAADAFKPFARGTAAFLPLPHCFELYGFDLAVDIDGRCVLLEVNSGPDIRYGQRLAADGDALVADVVSAVTQQLFGGYASVASAGASAALDVPQEPAPFAVSDGGDGAAPTVIGGFTCVLSRPCAARRAELARFKRAMATVGTFTHALRKNAGAPARGVQGAAMRAVATSG